MFAEDKKKLRFGIVGCGNIARTHMRSIAEIPGTILTAVVDVNEDAAKEAAAEYGCRYYFDYKTMIEDGDIDVIDICTPSGMRREIAIYSANHGKHIILEKPIEITTERIDDILAAANRNRVSVHGIYNRRFHDVYKWLKDYLISGRMGKLLFADVSMKWYREPDYYKNTWRGTWALDGGGALMNQCIHYVDLIQWLMGMPSHVFAYAGRLLHKDIETEDTAIALLKFKNDALGMIQASTAMIPGYSTRLSFHGQEGGIVLEDNNIVDFFTKSRMKDEDNKIIEKFSIRNKVKAESVSSPLVSDNTLHKRQLEHIAQSIKSNEDSSVNGYEARKSVQIIRAIYQSASQGEEISL
jgi:predicted dehydrogenase